jgi:hypothetical protein
MQWTGQKMSAEIATAIIVRRVVILGGRMA